MVRKIGLVLCPHFLAPPSSQRYETGLLSTAPSLSCEGPVHVTKANVRSADLYHSRIVCSGHPFPFPQRLVMDMLGSVSGFLAAPPPPLVPQPHQAGPPFSSPHSTCVLVISWLQMSPICQPLQIYIPSWGLSPTSHTLCPASDLV